MGMTCMHKPADVRPVDLIPTLIANDVYEVLEVSITGGAAYILCRDKQENKVAVLVMKIEYQRGHYNFCYGNAYPEEALPYFFDCPVRFLDQLPPTENKKALEWRRLCREAAAERAAKAATKRAKPKITDGCTVRFEQPIEFADGRVLDTFTAATYRKRRVFIHDGCYYSIPKVAERDYIIIQ